MELIQSRLVDLMRQRHMSYQDLSDITKINKATIHRYFTGTTRKIPIERIWPIAFALGTTPQYLMGDTDDPSPNQNETFASYIIPSQRSIENAPLFETLPSDIIITIKRYNHDPAYVRLLGLINQLKPGEIKPVCAFINMLVEESK